MLRTGIDLPLRTSSCSEPSNPRNASRVRRLLLMRIILPQEQPGCVLEFGLKQKKECIPAADRHSHKTCSVRGLLCLPAPERAQESGLPSVFAAIPHQRSNRLTRQNNLPCSLSGTPTHTHTAPLVCFKATLSGEFSLC